MVEINMRKNLILGIAIACLACFSGFLWWYTFGGSQTNDGLSADQSMNGGSTVKISSETKGFLENKLMKGNPESPIDALFAEDNAEEFDFLNEAEESNNIKLFDQAFSGNTSILKALKEINEKDSWGYDRIVKNLSLWKDLCNAGQLDSNLINTEDSGDDVTVEMRIAAFCDNFPADFSQELNDFAFTALQETALGLNEWSQRLNSIENQGPDLALQTAIIDLSDSLESGDYANVHEIIWFLGTSNLLAEETPVERHIAATFADVKVMMSVSASLYCGYLGGCPELHPVTLGLCLQFENRPCHNPHGVNQAIAQILTGREIVGFYRMRQEILTLLSQHRRGDF